MWGRTNHKSLKFLTVLWFQTDVNKKYTLFDIGMVEENLMGGMYQSTYTSKKYKGLYPQQFRRVRYKQGNLRI